MNQFFSKNQNQNQNVSDWERAASVIGGLVLVGRGLKKGGISGIVQLAMGGLAVARGVTGHCEAKRLLAEKAEDKAALDQRYSHMPMDSEVRSPDFEQTEVTLPDTAPMGNESVAPGSIPSPRN